MSEHEQSNEPEVKLERCAVCGLSDALISELWLSRRRLRFTVDCLACGHEGPASASVADAATAWNAEERHEPTKEQIWDWALQHDIPYEAAKAAFDDARVLLATARGSAVGGAGETIPGALAGSGEGQEGAPHG